MKFQLTGENIPDKFREAFEIDDFFAWLVETDKEFRQDFTEEQYYDFYREKGWILRIA